MTAFVFVGDPRMEGKDPTPECRLFGLTFPAGQPVEVTDEAAIRKLSTHSHFRKVGGAPASASPVAPRRGRPPKNRETEA